MYTGTMCAGRCEADIKFAIRQRLFYSVFVELSTNGVQYVSLLPTDCRGIVFVFNQIHKTVFVNEDTSIILHPERIQ